MAIPQGTFGLPQLGSKPSPPPVGAVIIYTRSAGSLYLQDSSGTEFVFGSVDFISQLTGDVSAIGPGSAAATVNFVGGESASDVASATVAYLSATSTNTPSTLVFRDGSGNFAANVITANLTGTATNATTAINFSGSLSGDVTGTQTATLISSTTVTGKLLTGYTTGSNVLINSSNTILTAFENLQAQIVATTGAAITTLTGDVSATGPGTATATVNSVGGSSAANIHSAELAANAATSVNTSGTIVERDASGNFAAGNITANLTGTATNATNATTAINFSGSLSGDVTGTQTATLISSTTVTGKLLTGYTVGPNTAILSSDSILTAFEKTQGQLNATLGAAITALTGDVSATGPGSVPATVLSIQGHAVSNTAPSDAQILIYSTGTMSYNPQSISGDASLTNAGLLTLATVNSNVGTFGSSTSIPTFTVNAKGLITAASGNAVVAPAGTLSGTTLNSTIVSSSLTSVGTITTGVWNGTPITAPFMLPLPNTDIYVGNASNQPTAVAVSGDLNITNTGVTTIQPNVVTNSKLAQMPADTIKGNNTGATANALDLTTAQVNALLGTITTIGTYNGNGSSANGLSISGVNLFAQSATITNPGMVDTTTQSFAGAKTFTNNVAISTASTTALTLASTSFVFDSTNQALGIGVQPSTVAFLDAVNSTAASKTLQLTGYGIGSTVGTRGRFARGTSGTPTAVQTGDIINFWSARGYGTSQFAAASTGAINAVAGENFTNTSNLTYLAFNTTPTGSVTSTENFRVASTGVTLGPQTSSTSIHQINGGLFRTNKTITANYTVDTTTTDDIILCNQTAGITITLPTPTNGRSILIKDISGNAQTNTITVARHASEKIENLAASRILYTNFGTWTFVSDGTNWWMC